MGIFLRRGTAQRGMLASELEVGQTIKLSVNGKAWEWLVVNQGLPSSIYDASCNGTWLLMKDIYEKRAWNSKDVNDYANSTIYSYLNNTFLAMFDSNIQKAIKQVKIPYRKNGGSVQSGANGLPCKIFLLSGYEVGWTTSTNQYFPIDGAVLNYFKWTVSTDSKRIAYLNGSAAFWWLRSPHSNITDYVWRVSTDGSSSIYNVSSLAGIRQIGRAHV